MHTVFATTRPGYLEPGRCSAGVMVCLALCSAASVSSAVEVPCAGSVLRADDALDASWHDALRIACRRLAMEADVDASAQVRVIQRGEQLFIEVRLPDGRTAERSVGRAEDVLPTLEALLALPPATGRSPALREARPSNPPSGQAPAPSPPAPVALHLDVGGGLLTRIAGSVPYGSIGPSGFASFRSGRWLLDVAMRLEALESPLASSDSPMEMQTVAATFSVDRRVVQRGLTLDVGVGPSLVLETQSKDVGGDEKAGSETDLRIATHARMAVGDGPLKWALGLDGEVAPSRLQKSRRIDELLPPLPAWSAGLLMGVVWSEP